MKYNTNQEFSPFKANDQVKRYFNDIYRQKLVIF